MESEGWNDKIMRGEIMDEYKDYIIHEDNYDNVDGEIRLGDDKLNFTSCHIIDHSFAEVEWERNGCQEVKLRCYDITIKFVDDNHRTLRKTLTRFVKNSRVELSIIGADVNIKSDWVCARELSSKCYHGSKVYILELRIIQSITYDG